MNMLLVQYDPFGDVAIHQWVEAAMACHGECYSSEVSHRLGYDEDPAFDEVMRAAIRACAALHLAVRYHFLPVYRQGGHGLYADWRLSRLACVLIAMNADIRHPEVAEAQLQILHTLLP